jgi:arylsulfatase A-like enzyme
MKLQKNYITACLLVLMCGRLVAETAAPTGRPNILYIFADDLSYRSISCYKEAHPWVATPNIDRLAELGVRFTQAYIGGWCMPSRATQLTGLLPFGIESMRSIEPYPTAAYDPKLCPFWPSAFRKNGYQTAQIGKWHLGPDTGYGRDWDYQVVWNYSSGRPTSSGTLEYYYDQTININGGDAHIEKGYATDNYTRWAEEYIRGGNRDKTKPWFLWLCYTAPHTPSIPAERHLGDYPGATVPDPVDIYPPRPGKPDYARTAEKWIKGSHGEPISLKRRSAGIYGNTLSAWSRQAAQTVQSLDEGVGRLLEVLAETGQLENTLVVFTSDQGFALGQHGFDAKHAPYDANLRAPLIVSMPGTLPQDVVATAPVNGADLVPTFFHFAGIDLPWAMHGHDLSPLLRDPGVSWPYPVLLTNTLEFFGSDTETYRESKEPIRSGVAMPWWIFLVNGHYKYIRTITDGLNEELYDLASDPDELVNLAGDARYVSTVGDLRGLMIEELRRINAGIVNQLPEPRSR